MKKSKPIIFGDFRQLLEGLGFCLNQTKSGAIFHNPDEGSILFRTYRENEPVDPGDVLYARKFLDLRGVLAEAAFDTQMQRANKPA